MVPTGKARGILCDGQRWQCLSCLSNGTKDEAITHYAGCPVLGQMKPPADAPLVVARAQQLAAAFYLAQGFMEAPAWDDIGRDFQLGFLHLAEKFLPEETTHQMIDGVAYLVRSHGCSKAAAAIERCKFYVPDVPVAP